MDLNFMFFQLPPALNLIFNISYIPQEEDFKELTPEQYQQLQLKVSEEELQNLENQKVFALIPDDPQIMARLNKLYEDELSVVSENEINIFKAAAKFIENCIKDSDEKLESINDKLSFVASHIPDVFSTGTPYAIHGQRKN